MPGPKNPKQKVPSYKDYVTNLSTRNTQIAKDLLLCVEEDNVDFLGEDRFSINLCKK